MPDNVRPSFGDNVRIRSTPETELRGLAGRLGSVSGFTTPSVTSIEAIGSLHEDYALAVMFKDGPVQYAWFAEELVEFIDHAPGTVIRVGNLKAVRNADGTWTETFIGSAAGQTTPKATAPRKPWWKRWSRG
jgi:hypothetical protein